MACRLLRPSKVKPNSRIVPQDKPPKTWSLLNSFGPGMSPSMFSLPASVANDNTGGSDGKLCRLHAKASGSPTSRKQLRDADRSTSEGEVRGVPVRLLRSVTPAGRSAAKRKTAQSAGLAVQDAGYPIGETGGFGNKRGSRGATR